MAAQDLPGRRFSPAEDMRLLRLRLRGWSLGRIATALGRPRSSIQVRLDYLTQQQAEAGMAGSNGSAGRLLIFIERIERLQEEIKALQSDVKDIKAEAKSAGFDVKVLTQMIRERKMDAADRAEWQALCETYRAALGMLDGTPLGEAARKRFTGDDDDEEDAAEAAAPPPPTAAPSADDVPAARAQGGED